MARSGLGAVPVWVLWVLCVLVILVLIVVGGLVLRWRDHRLQQPDRLLVYKQVGVHALALHVFAPPASAWPGPRPALLLLHGGGWQHGDPAQFYPQCRHFSRLGMVCISAAYRVASMHDSTPADALQDARDAMRYLRRHALALGIDARRMAAGGGSAGGQLAAALATGVPLPDPDADPLAPTRPDALLLYNPMLDLSPGMPDHGLVGAAWAQLSPRQRVGPGMPPTLVLSGGADPEVSVATVQGFCQAVQAHGGDCTLHIIPGAGHGFFNAGVDGGRHVPTSLLQATQFLAQRGYLVHPTP